MHVQEATQLILQEPPIHTMPPYQPYAPTAYLPAPLPTSTTPPTTTNSNISTISHDTEAKLSVAPAQRALYDSLAEIYALITTLDYVEKAYLKDSIAADAYSTVCTRLLSQYQALISGDPVVSEAFGDLESFRRRYGVDCAAAMRRIEAGSPAVTANPVATSSSIEEDEPASSAAALSSVGAGASNGSGRWKNVSPKAAAEATQNFITFMDALRLNFRAKDELHPLLAPVITSVDAVTGGGGGEEWEGRKDVVRWLIVLNQMRPGDEINEEQGREMLWDLERGYGSFLEGLG
jgi:ESCRT-I complex subunit VPS28